MRIDRSSPELPAVQRGRQIEIFIDGDSVTAFKGETVAAVLLAEGIRTFGHSSETGKPRSMYCGIGICYQCLVTVDGVPNIRACQTPVADGMAIETRSQVEL